MKTVSCSLVYKSVGMVAPEDDLEVMTNNNVGHVKIIGSK
jgi:hypothetical protein